MKELSLEERMSNIESAIAYFKSTMNDIREIAYRDAVNSNDDITAAKLVREKRDELLRETDYLFLLDSSNARSVSNANELEVYRQLLRDIPNQSGFPFYVVFPKKPDGLK